MANSLLTPTVIAKETLVVLENNLVLSSRVNRRDEAFTAKIGDSYTYRPPNQYAVNDGPGLVAQDTEEPSVIITIDKQKHVGLFFGMKDLTLTIEEFSDRYIKPSMAALANQVEFDGFQEFKNVPNLVGTPGTTPSSFATSVQLAGQRLDENGAPRYQRCMSVNPAGHWAIAGGMQANFVSPVIEDTEIKGFIPPIGGFEMLMSQNVASHTVGAHGGTPLTNGVGVEGASTLVTDGWTASTAVLAVGDVFTIAAVNAVNPQSKVSTGNLKQYVVTAAGTSDGSGNLTISISPALEAAGGNQNIDALPADGAAITVVGTLSTAYPQNLAWCPDAFALAMADLEVPQGVDFAAKAEYKGFSCRIVRDYDINNDNLPCRVDALYGWKTIRPPLAVRLIG